MKATVVASARSMCTKMPRWRPDVAWAKSGIFGSLLRRGRLCSLLLLLVLGLVYSVAVEVVKVVMFVVPGDRSVSRVERSSGKRALDCRSRASEVKPCGTRIWFRKDPREVQARGCRERFLDSRAGTKATSDSSSILQDTYSVLTIACLISCDSSSRILE